MAEVISDTRLRSSQEPRRDAVETAAPVWMPAVRKGSANKRRVPSTGPGVPPKGASKAYKDWIGALIDANDAGDLAWYRGQPDQAAESFERGLKHIQRTSNGDSTRPETRFWQATLLRNLAVTDLHRGDVDKSLERLESAARIAAEIEGSDGWYALCDAAVSRADALRWLGKFSEAEACLAEVGEAPDEATRFYGRIRLGLQRAAIFRNRGSFEEARAVLDELRLAIELLASDEFGRALRERWLEGERLLPIARMLVRHDIATVAVDQLLSGTTVDGGEAVAIAASALPHAQAAHKAASSAGPADGYLLYRLRSEKLLLWLTLQAGGGAFVLGRAEELLAETRKLNDIKGSCLALALLGSAMCSAGSFERGHSFLGDAFDLSRKKRYWKGQRLAAMQALARCRLDASARSTWRERLATVARPRRARPTIAPPAALTDPVWVAFGADGAVLAWRDSIDALREAIGPDTAATLARRNRADVEAEHAD